MIFFKDVNCPLVGGRPITCNRTHILEPVGKSTYKTVSQLRDAFKSTKKSANQKATTGPHRDALDRMQQQLTDQKVNEDYLSEFATPSQPSRVKPNLSTFLTAGTQTEQSTLISNATNAHRAETTAAPAMAPTAAPEAAPTEIELTKGNGKNTRAGKRCRTCGLEINAYREKHIPIPPPVIEGERVSNRNLMITHRCEIDSSQYKPGYPLKEGQMHPRRPRKRKNT
jgi:hypothetical protein